MQAPLNETKCHNDSEYIWNKRAGCFMKNQRYDEHQLGNRNSESKTSNSDHGPISSQVRIHLVICISSHTYKCIKNNPATTGGLFADENHYAAISCTSPHCSSLFSACAHGFATEKSSHEKIRSRECDMLLRVLQCVSPYQRRDLQMCSTDLQPTCSTFASPFGRRIGHPCSC